MNLLKNQKEVTELVVLSGKGGTGKTSLVGAIAALAGDKVLVDCDVDAANLHLILGSTIKASLEFIAGGKASVRVEKCIACGLCLDYCRFGAIKCRADSRAMFGETFWIDDLFCEGCGVCVHFCQEKAIEFREVISGDWFLSETAYGPMIHARLRTAQANSGKLAALLRRVALSHAQEYNLNLIIVDGPPGIGCPAIATVSGADYVLIITEPSVSAFHDLKRLLDLTSHFKIPAGLCINKSDINPGLAREIREFAEIRKIRVLGEIRYDPLVTRALMSQRPLVEYTENETTDQMKNLWKALRRELEMSGKIRRRAGVNIRIN
jgi:MinD superfamily P-loop ATPase